MYKLIANNRLSITKAKNETKQKLFGEGIPLFIYLGEAV